MLQPVYRLPPETLSSIARYVIHENDGDTRSIIPLTHVCRYWRESIIAEPGNWALVSNRSPAELTRLSLAQCKAAPLELRLSASRFKKNPEFSTLMTPYIRNIEKLYSWKIAAIEVLAQIPPNLHQSTPNLRSLLIVGRGDWDWSTDPFGPFTPTLTHLSSAHIPLYPSFLCLGALTYLSLHYKRFDLHLDTLLDFLEENRSLEHANLAIRFGQPSLRSSSRQIVMRNRLQVLSMSSGAADTKALISKIALRRGAHLGISLPGPNAGLNYALPVTSMIHLSNLRSPTFMEYHPDNGSIRLLGPNGSFTIKSSADLENPFAEFTMLPLTNVRVFSLILLRPLGLRETSVSPITFPPPSLSALETLTIECKSTFDVSRLFSPLFSNPSSFPSLKILAFLDCDLDEGFMKALTRFASNRKKTASAWLHRAVIVSSKGVLPNVASIDALGEHVPVVNAQIGKKLPADLI